MEKYHPNDARKFCVKQLAILEELIEQVNEEGYNDSIPNHSEYLKTCEAYLGFIEALDTITTIEKLQ